MKLLIQIPCYNEEQTLGVTLSELPRQAPGFDSIEWLVIDDGSTDRTVEVARAHGVDHIVRLPQHQGLARCFRAGIDACLARGADVIVNTDADNQYCAADIDVLVAPIRLGRAEMVVGTRAVESLDTYGWGKRFLHRLGGWVVRAASCTQAPDPPSGFRALSRAAAQQLHVFGEYTYTLETLIQAGQKGMAVEFVPVRTNPQLRPSRLIRNVPTYVARSVMTIARIFMTYRPFPFFAVPGAAGILAGLALSLRFLLCWWVGQGDGKVQSLLLATLLLGTGFFLLVTGLLADLISVNRKLLERIDFRMHQLETANRSADSGGASRAAPPAEWVTAPRPLAATAADSPHAGPRESLT